MDEKYVDEFFEHGRLRLSSFDIFAKHFDEERRDVSEGKMVSTLSDGEWTAFLGSGFGHDCYVLCGTTSCSRRVQEAFGISGLVINDTVAFAAALARALPNFVGGIEGDCIYAPTRVVRQRMDEGELKRLFEQKRNADGTIDMSLISELMPRTQLDALFGKEDRYEHQREYRFFWKCEVVGPFIDIVAPSARQFCSKFTPDQTN